MSDWLVQVGCERCGYSFDLGDGVRGCNHPVPHHERVHYKLVYCKPSHCPVRTLDAKELENILNEAWGHEMRNVGTKHEFYSCYTYSGGNTPHWIERTRKILNKPKKVPHYKG